MTTTLDLNLLPVARYAGREYPEMLGLYSAEPPRRTARGRSLDRLVLYLVFDGNAPLPADQRDRALADLARLYYQTAGSVTAGLRRTAGEFNTLLLERNRQLGANRQCTAHLTQVVLRDDRLTIAQSGQLHAYLVAAEGVAHFHDPENAGLGLGLSRSAAVSFSQAALKPNDTLILAALPSPDWNLASLAGIHGQGPESLRRKLFQQSSSDLNALALQAKQGKGKFYLLRSAASQPASPSAEPLPPQPAPQPALQAAPHVAQQTVSSVAQPAAIPLNPPAMPPQAPTASISELSAPAPAIASTTASELFPAPVQKSSGEIESLAAATAAVAAAPPAAGKRRSILASAGDFFARIGAALSGGFRTLLGRMLPDEAFLNIPSGVMALIALAVPVVIVTAASVVYFRLGRAAQYELLSSQARQVALQAMEQTDLGAKRSGLGTASSLLQKAETFATTPETAAEIQSLRAQVRTELDSLDFVRRVSYAPAIIGALPLTSEIVRMVAFDDELYLLDGTDGSVLRALLTDQGYDLDYTFQCGPGTYGETAVGAIVEIVAWPAGYEPAAKVLGVDTAGNVLFCQPDQMPEARRLAKPAEGDSWGNIIGATLDQGDFYALDLPSNGVWIYWAGNFSEQPTLFFDEQIPQMKDVVHMLVDRDDLYLLQSNGSMMLCARDTLVVAPTRCAIQSYLDRRPGRENMPLTPETPFTQMLSTTPPDPSLYLLEPKSQAFYHFSLRNLAFQKQYLPEKPLAARNASAFAINTARRILYLALGNQVFYAAMP